MSGTPDFDAVMTAARQWYYTGIRQLVDEAIKEALKHPPEEREDFLFRWVRETTDGHEFAVYNARNVGVLLASDNDDAWLDAYNEDEAVSNTVKAVMAMEADATELLDARRDEWSNPAPMALKSGTTVHLLNTPDSYADGTTDNVAVHHCSEDDKTTDEAIQAEVERLLGFKIASVRFVDAGDHPTEIESIYRVTLETDEST